MDILPFDQKLPAIILLNSIMSVVVSMESALLVAMTSREVRAEQDIIIMGLINSFVRLGRIVEPVAGGVLLDIQLKLPL